MTTTSVFRNESLLKEIESYTWNTPTEQLAGIYFMLENEKEVELKFSRDITADLSCVKTDGVWVMIDKRYRGRQRLSVNLDEPYANIRDVLRLIYAILINYRIDVNAFEEEMLLITTERTAEYSRFRQTVATPHFFRSLQKPIVKETHKRFIEMMHVLDLPRLTPLKKKI